MLQNITQLKNKSRNIKNKCIVYVHIVNKYTGFFFLTEDAFKPKALPIKTFPFTRMSCRCLADATRKRRSFLFSTFSSGKSFFLNLIHERFHRRTPSVCIIAECIKLNHILHSARSTYHQGYAA